ncbi:MAG: hypothetical protein EA394_02185 [Bacteroidia bacterium]|nr:MAG: hypothetical protein EA394_02185 [Bacteroidia bacterium]
MKTRMIITAALILFTATFVTAGSKQRTLSFRDALGRTFTISVVEEKEDPAPFNLGNEFKSNVSSRVFDISSLMKPEQEEEVPAEISEAFNHIK